MTSTNDAGPAEQPQGERVFGMPACPDDMESGIDVEGLLWARGQTPNTRTRWTSTENGVTITEEWDSLIWNYGPIKEAPRRAAAGPIKRVSRAS